MAMKHFYSEDSEGIVVTFNDIHEKGGIEAVPFYIEQMTTGEREPFNYAQGTLPFFRFEKTSGFSSEQLADLMDYIRQNAVLIYDLARDESAA
jgi:hypothetical protein